MNTIVQTAIDNGSFTTLVTAVTAAHLVDTLSGDGPFTVFAPTDAAFAKVPAETMQAVLANPEMLTKILTYHVVSGKVMAAQVTGMTSAKTVEGSDVAIKVVDGKVMINNATVVIADVECTNGVIHAIDTVLMPS